MLSVGQRIHIGQAVKAVATTTIIIETITGRVQEDQQDGAVLETTQLTSSVGLEALRKTTESQAVPRAPLRMIITQGSEVRRGIRNHPLAMEVNPA